MTDHIKQIFEKLGKEVISIKDSSKGCDQIVKIVKCTDDTYVYKEPKKDYFKIYNEYKGCQLAEKVGIPAPKIMKKTKKYLIQTCIPGKTLNLLKPTERIYVTLGKYLKNLHTKKAPYVGEKGWLHTEGEIELFEKFIKQELPQLKKYMPEKKQLITKYFRTYKKLLSDVPKVYCHSDLYEDNIMVFRKEVSGIIDWGDLYGSYPEHDISVVYIEREGDKYFDAFLKGHGSCDLKLLHFATMCRLSWMLNGSFKEGKTNTQRFHKYMKLFERILKT